MDELNPAPARPARVLLDLAEERLAPSEVEALGAWLKAEGLSVPPPWVQRRAERIARQRRAPRRARRHLVAALAFDSREQLQFVGLRATPTNVTRVRRLLFQTENVEVDLEMSPVPSSDQIRLAGQVTAGGSDPSGGFLRLSTSDGEWSASLDEAGEFRFDSLAPGAYRLQVFLPDKVIEVPILPL
jgi:hypothetical protein